MCRTTANKSTVGFYISVRTVVGAYQFSTRAAHSLTTTFESKSIVTVHFSTFQYTDLGSLPTFTIAGSAGLVVAAAFVSAISAGAGLLKTIQLFRCRKGRVGRGTRSRSMGSVYHTDPQSCCCWWWWRWLWWWLSWCGRLRGCSCGRG